MSWIRSRHSSVNRGLNTSLRSINSTIRAYHIPKFRHTRDTLQSANSCKNCTFCTRFMFTRPFDRDRYETNLSNRSFRSAGIGLGNPRPGAYTFAYLLHTVSRTSLTASDVWNAKSAAHESSLLLCVSRRDDT